MGISLNGLTPAGTYPGLIKTGDNTAISGTPKVLSDGNGNNLPMEVSTTGVNLTGSPTVNSVAIANTTQLATKQDTLVSGTNIKTINGASLLGSGNIPVVTSPSGVAGAIQFSNGSAFASDAANLFWDDTNNRLGVGTNSPSATAHFQGSGSTFATTSLLVQNSAGKQIFKVSDDASFTFGSGGTAEFQGNVSLRGVNDSGNVSNNLRFIVSGSTKSFLINANYSNTNAPSAMLEVQSTTKGFLPPVMTTTQKNAIASPAAGLVVYDSTTNKLCCYNGSTWNDLF
jgi:hypothetical protein